MERRNCVLTLNATRLAVITAGKEFVSWVVTTHEINLQTIEFFVVLSKRLIREVKSVLALLVLRNLSIILWVDSVIFLTTHKLNRKKTIEIPQGKSLKFFAYLFAENGNIFAEGIWWAYIATGNAGFAGCTCREFTFLKY